jgi:hypothetical protein
LTPFTMRSHRQSVRGMRAGWALGCCLFRRKPLQTRLFLTRLRHDLRLSRPAPRVAGISGFVRLRAGIPVRDVRGMKRSRRSMAQSTRSAAVVVWSRSPAFPPRNEDGAPGRPIFVHHTPEEVTASGRKTRRRRCRYSRRSAGRPLRRPALSRSLWGAKTLTAQTEMAGLQAKRNFRHLHARS